MVTYEIRKLTDELVLITWFRSPVPNSQDEHNYIEELRSMLDTSENELYFISDLRLGRIMGAKTLQRLGDLSHHANWAGSTAFSQNPVTSLFVRNFAVSGRNVDMKDELKKTLDEALNYLETLKPGITRSIDWDSIISGRSADTDAS